MKIVKKIEALKKQKKELEARRQKRGKITIPRSYLDASREPSWAKKLYEKMPYKILYGGRGAGKSTRVADALLRKAAVEKLKIVCAREFQSSIGDSVYSLLVERMTAIHLRQFYTVTDRYIKSRTTDSIFIFKGIARNTENIKSIPGISILWIEEGQSISEKSWSIVEPTVRDEEAEIWITFNPLNADDIIYQEFVAQAAKYKGDAYIQKISWRDNPEFPETLNKQRLRSLASGNLDKHNHIWEGELYKHSHLQIFHGCWEERDFTSHPSWTGPFFGADFGFGSSPTTLVKFFIFDECLWIEYESYEYELKTRQINSQWMTDVPNCQYEKIKADSARKGTIEDIRTDTFNPFPRIEGATKGPGSIKDGIEKIKGFRKVYIHPRCKNTLSEFRLYQFKADKSGKATDIIVDENNHAIDSIRYGLEDYTHPVTISSELDTGDIGLMSDIRDIHFQ